MAKCFVEVLLKGKDGHAIIWRDMELDRVPVAGDFINVLNEFERGLRHQLAVKEVTFSASNRPVVTLEDVDCEKDYLKYYEGERLFDFKEHVLLRECMSFFDGFEVEEVYSCWCPRLSTFLSPWLAGFQV